MGPVAKDHSKVDFEQRILEIINDGALALLLSIGHRTGLFDALAEHPAATAAEIAAAAGLDETRVQGWLDGMARGGIVSFDTGTARYQLPPEHAACLTGGRARENLAALAEYVPILASAEDRIVESFQKEGRTPYGSRPSFRQLLSEEAQQGDEAVVAALVESILSPVPGLVDALHSGIDVLDVVCGTGRALNLAASTFPKSRFRGYDPLPERVEKASFRAFEMGLNNIRFHTRDAETLEEPARYDLITDFDALREANRPREVLQNVFDALRPGGIFLMQEVCVTSRVPEELEGNANWALQTAGALAEEDAEREVLTCEAGTTRILQEIGFERVTVNRLPHHIYNCYFIATKGHE